MIVYDTVSIDLPAPGSRLELFRDLAGKTLAETNLVTPRRVPRTMRVKHISMVATGQLPDGQVVVYADNRRLLDQALSGQPSMTWNRLTEAEGIVRDIDDLVGRVTLGLGGSGRLIVKVTLEGPADESDQARRLL